MARSKVKLLDAQGAPIEETKAVAEVQKLPVHADNLMAALMRAASDPAIQPEKMRAILDMRNELMEQEAAVMFQAAFLAMHAELPTITTDNTIEIPAKAGGSPQGRQSRKQATPYATYPNIQKHTDPILRKHGFTLMLQPEPREGGGILMKGELSYVCETQYGRLVHTTRCLIPVPLESGGSKNDAQGISSSIAYGKRNARIILLDIVTQALVDQEKEIKGAKAAAEAQEEQIILISSAQEKALVKALEDARVPMNMFYDKFHVERVSDLPAHLFGDAISACTAYKERTQASTNG